MTPSGRWEPDRAITTPRLLALAAGWVLLVAAISALTSMPATDQPSPSTAQSSPVPSLASPFDMIPRIAIAYESDEDGGRGFNELARAGVQRAADRFDAEVIEAPAKPDDTDADREERLTQLAEAGHHPIFAIGSAYAGPLARVAPKYPRTRFSIVNDGTVDAPNVVGILFNDEQGAFLVGAAAALTSETGDIGFVGAVEDPRLQRFEAGFTAGARTVRPDVKVQVANLAAPRDGDAIDPAEARDAALRMIDSGADVIFAADRDLSVGVIRAANDRGIWAIGIDGDQYQTTASTEHGVILTSMLRRVDVATYTITMEIANRVSKDGNNVFGLDRDGVGYATSGGFIDPIRARLDDLAAMIASGEIHVPTKP